MNDYSKKILKVPTVTFVREQDQGKQPIHTYDPRQY